MSELNDNDELNEFGYTEEELAKLAELDAANEHSDELTDTPADEVIKPEPVNTDEPGDDLTLDDEFIDDLLQPGEVKKDPEPAKEPEIDPEPEVEPEPIPDYDEQLEELEQQKQAAQGEVDDTLDQLQKLAEDFDEGEISQGKYDVEKLKLERALRRQERALEQAEQDYQSLSSEATTKVEQYHESRRTVWREDLVSFLEDPANAVIANNQHIAQQFDGLLQSMGQSGVFEGLNNQQILQSVRNQLSFRVPELSKTAYTPKQNTQPKPPKPSQANAKVPASLSQMSAQEMPADDPFAYIRKLSGVKYEEAISKLSPEQQEAFFFG
ncbi:TPA: hypothetical protein ACVB8O_002149 [Acinetobacter baumannii]